MGLVKQKSEVTCEQTGLKKCVYQRKYIPPKLQIKSSFLGQILVPQLEENFNLPIYRCFHQRAHSFVMQKCIGLANGKTPKHLLVKCQVAFLFKNKKI